MQIKAAINGGTSRRSHAGVPTTPHEIAADVEAVIAAGAFAVHFHPRDPNGDETLKAEYVAEAIRAVRERVPAASIGVTTGAWIVPDPVARRAEIRRWRELPDFASVNFCEDGAEEIAADLLANGVAIEAGLSHAAAAERYVRSDLVNRCIRILLEPQEASISAATENVESIEQIVAAIDTATPRLLHGTGPTAWPMLRLAASRGYASRIGFEDTIVLENGDVAASNAMLIREARNLREASGS